MPNFIGGDTRDEEPIRIPIKSAQPAQPTTRHPQRASDEKPDDLWVRGTGKDTDVSVYMASQGEINTLVERHLYLRESDRRHRYFLFEIPMSRNTEISVPRRAPICELEALRFQYVRPV